MQNELTPEQRAHLAQQNLETLYLFSDRFSHSIRTHLSVSMGIIDDFVNGYELNEADRADAQRALRSILHTLDSVRDVTQTPRFTASALRLDELVTRGFEHTFGLAFEVAPLLDIESSSTVRQIDEKLLYHALRCLLLYLHARIKEQEPNEASPIRIRVHSKDSCDVIEVIVIQEGPRDDSPFKETKLLSDVAKIDHSPDSLGLIFAEQVFAAHGGSSSVELTPENELIFRGSVA